MAFKLGDLIIDRIQYGYAEDFEGNPKYVLTQLSEAQIEISAESKDAKDKDGTLVKRFWQGKTGTFTAKNAMLNMNVIADASGSAAVYAASGAGAIAMPKICVVAKGATLDVTGYKAGTVVVRALDANGSMGTEEYTLDSAAGATTFKIATADGTSTLTPPTATGVDRYIVKYDRDVEDGAVIKNSADKFPSTVKLTLKALCVDPCEADTLRACYIVLPSFQVSPEVNIDLQTEATLDYKGDLQVDYCSADKSLYEVYIAADDEEE